MIVLFSYVNVVTDKNGCFTDGLEYNMVVVNRILGLCPMMSLYHNPAGTIPEWATSQSKNLFPPGIYRLALNSVGRNS